MEPLGCHVKQKNRSWWALVAFCTTTALVVALGLGIFFASASVAFAIGRSVQAASPAQAGDDQQTVAGVITDSHCGARHEDSTRSPAECARMCVRNGSKYVLVDGDKIYELQGDASQIAPLAGQRVSISGKLSGQTLRIDSIHAQQ